MALESGTQLSHYKITDQIGKGGMGEVYRAQDTKLGREVAIKVLPSEFSQDAERLARLEREARMLAALNHPNIAAIHGLEESDDTRFLVLELVEGDTLADCIKGGAIPVEESLRLALQIAEALEAAHEKGVIHRDLKPANIKITTEGRLKVLDFGLAKAFVGDQADVNLSNSPTLSLQATQQGVILGTAGYMSPEQAQGHEVDRRADIWAFGCILYEMLTGRPVFAADSVSRTLARVLERDPDLSVLPPGLDPKVTDLLERCLEKEARDRWHDVADIRVGIARIVESSGGVGRELRGVAAAPAQSSKLPWLVAAAGIVIAAALGWFLRPMPVPDVQPVARFPFLLPEGRQFIGFGSTALAISPDGTHFAYTANDGLESGLYLRDLAEMEARRIPGPGDDGTIPIFPVFSPDGQWLAYLAVIEGGASYELKRVPITGGSPVTLYRSDPIMRDLEWDASDRILAMIEGDIVAVPANGGEAELLAEAPEGTFLGSPRLLASGTWLLSSRAPGAAAWNAAEIVVSSLESDDEHVVWEAGGADARYLPTGHIVFVQGNTLFALPFDLDRMEATGGPVPIVEGLQRSPNASSGTGQYGVSATGTLIHIPATAAAGNDPAGVLALADRSGSVERFDLEPGQYRGPRVSPDGTEVAVEVVADNQRSAIYVYDMSGRRAFRRLLGAGNNIRPIWTPNGERITFASDRSGAWGLYSQPADGSGEAELLAMAEEGVQYYPDSWSADMTTLGFTRLVGSLGAIASQTVWTLPFDDAGQPGEPVPLVEPDGGGAAFSPGGEWVAYRAGAGAASQLQVQPFPPTGAVYPVTEQGGSYPAWSPDGRRLIYRRPAPQGGTSQVLVGVDVTTEAGFAWGDETIEPLDNFLSYFGYRDYDFFPDGDSLVINMPVLVADTTEDEPERPRINVVMNWFQELQERVPIR